jgi:hypothetical protein
MTRWAKLECVDDASSQVLDLLRIGSNREVLRFSVPKRINDKLSIRITTDRCPYPTRYSAEGDSWRIHLELGENVSLAAIRIGNLGRAALSEARRQIFENSKWWKWSSFAVIMVHVH